MRARTWRRRMAGFVVGAVAVGGALAGCSGGGGSDTRTAMPSLAPAQSSPAPGQPGTRAGEVTPTRVVSCDAHTCTLTLRTTDLREVRAFGTTLSLGGIQNGSAGLTVGDGSVDCSAGESVRSGPLILFCDDVRADSVTLTAEVG